jgi:hypothetical protein
MPLLARPQTLHRGCRLQLCNCDTHARAVSGSELTNAASANAEHGAITFNVPTNARLRSAGEDAESAELESPTHTALSLRQVPNLALRDEHGGTLAPKRLVQHNATGSQRTS